MTLTEAIKQAQSESNRFRLPIEIIRDNLSENDIEHNYEYGRPQMNSVLYTDYDAITTLKPEM